MNKQEKQIDKLIEDYEYLKELVESKYMVSQLSESKRGYLLKYFGIRNTEDLSDKCDELQQEIKELKYEQLREYGLKFKNSLKEYGIELNELNN